MPALTIVIPVYGQFELLERCLAAIDSSTELDHEVVVVDDASPSGPPKIGPSRRLISRNVNGGFAAAVNTGILASRGHLVAIVNSDAVVTDGWDTSLLEALEGGLGIAAACQVDEAGEVIEAGTLVGPDGHVVLNVARDHEPAAGGSHPLHVPAVGAACVMARAVDLRQWGGFSEAYGRGYYEDIDLSLLLSRLGRRCGVATGAKVEHGRHGTFSKREVTTRLGVGRAVLGRRRRWELRGRPSVHRWESFGARRTFGWSYGSAGRVVLLGQTAELPVACNMLDEVDIATSVVATNDHLVELMSDLSHWADLVAGSSSDLVAHGPVVAEHQPRAVLVDVDLSSKGGLRRLLKVCEDNGLGSSRRQPADQAAAGPSGCRTRSLVWQSSSRQENTDDV